MIVPPTKIQFSFFMLAYVMVIHGLALLNLLIYLPWFVKILGSIFCGVSCAYYLRKYVWLTLPSSISHFWKHASGDWFISNVSEEIFPVELLPSSVVTTFLLVLNFRNAQLQRSFSVIIFKDAISDEMFRKICLVLRHSRQQTSETLPV